MSNKQQFAASYRIIRLIDACKGLPYNETRQMLADARERCKLDHAVFWSAVSCFYSK